MRRAAGPESARFAVSFPADVHPGPITGRVLLFVSRSNNREPRYASLGAPDLQAVYAIDVNDLAPGTAVTFSPRAFRSPDALAYPGPLSTPKPGPQYAQAVIDLDQTRPDLNVGGNLYRRIVECNAPAGSGPQTWELVADRVTAEAKPPQDTDRVKLVEIDSKLLSDFHGRQVKLRAAVALPADYDRDPNRQFPTVYSIPGFGGDHLSAWWRPPTGKQQMIRVTLDPKVPLGHSVFANSANNGPVGDALVQELIPEIEKRFRAVPHPYARFVTGHSSGGWSSLWLQVTYPDFFGGCWSTSPDPVDFRYFQTMNIYEDRNGHWTREGYPRPLSRRGTEITVTFVQQNRWEYVLGYGDQLDSFNAVFSPRGADGRPRPIMNKLTGAIDPEVAAYWKRYDIRLLLQDKWSELGPKLKGKLHIIGGGWDTYYLEMAVVALGDFLKTTDYAGYVEILPGDHGSYHNASLQDRLDREMSDAFAAGQKALQEQAGRPTN